MPKRRIFILRAIAELSLDRFSFDSENWWAPTLDLLSFSDSEMTIGKSIFLIEEYVHRQIFVPTEVWMWSAWMEMLSNCEFLLLLKTLREIQDRKPTLKVYSPLKMNKKNHNIPDALKLKIQDISIACQNIHLNIRACEPVVESVILFLLRKWMKNNEREFQKIKKKKLETYKKVESTYPFVEKILDKIDSELLTLVTGCIFSLNSCKDYPPAIISNSFPFFNTNTARNVDKRIKKLANRLKTKINNRTEFIGFAGENKLEFSELNDLREGVQKAMAIVPDIVRINGYDAFAEWIDRMSTPSGYPFLNLLVANSRIKSGDKSYGENAQQRFTSRGKATMRIQEKGDSYDLDFRNEVPDFIRRSMVSSLEATLLKYALLDGKSVPLRNSAERDTLIYEFLGNMKFENVKH